MKISIIGPGFIEIPPKGWGAVEILIWDMSQALKELGHEVQIVNTGNPAEMIDLVSKFSPDFVHVQYDDFVVLCPDIHYPCAITTHYAYLNRPEMIAGYWRKLKHFPVIQPNIFALSKNIKQFYVGLGIPEERVFVTPNGVNLGNFRYAQEPKHGDSSIYLAKIDHRKRQWLFQGIDSLYFVGNIDSSSRGRFDVSKNYLGEWSKAQLHNELTDYGNLVLLSDAEAHSLVCMEALAAGLGLVICEWATANLDLSKEFIAVIPEDKIRDTKYVEKKIIENRGISLNKRKEIVEYSKGFDWKKVLTEYHIPFMGQIINGSLQGASPRAVATDEGGKF
jgi:glycosyltransferase involved in cell wall biosynthesis